MSVLVGWLFDITSLKSIYGLITMKPNAALGLILIGVSLLAVKASGQNSFRILGQVCAASAALMGLLILSQYVFGWNLGIDQLLFSEEPGALATTSPGRVGITASSAFMMYGAALLLLYQRRAASHVNRAIRLRLWCRGRESRTPKQLLTNQGNREYYESF